MYTALSINNVGWSLGLIVAPTIGGFFVTPISFNPTPASISPTLSTNPTSLESFPSPVNLNASSSVVDLESVSRGNVYEKRILPYGANISSIGEHEDNRIIRDKFHDNDSLNDIFSDSDVFHDSRGTGDNDGNFWPTDGTFPTSSNDELLNNVTTAIGNVKATSSYNDNMTTTSSHVTNDDGFFDIFPFLLPNLIVAALNAICVIIIFWKLPKRTR